MRDVTCNIWRSFVCCHFFPVSVGFDVKCNCHNNISRASFVAFKTRFLQRLQELKRSSDDKNNRYTYILKVSRNYFKQRPENRLCRFEEKRIGEGKMRQGGSVKLFTQYILI